MKILRSIKTFIIPFLVVANLQAQDPSLPVQQKPYAHTDSNPIAVLKEEYSKAKDAVNKIRDGQNPSIIRSGVSTLESMIKEVSYITTAAIFGGGSVALLGTTASIIILPVTILTCYISLKLIFAHVITPYKQELIDHKAEESLQSLEKTLATIDSEIKKIEYAVQTQKAAL